MNRGIKMNGVGHFPPNFCPDCGGACTLPGDGPHGQLGGVCMVCSWDYLHVRCKDTDDGEPCGRDVCHSCGGTQVWGADPQPGVEGVGAGL